jgi:hypothetical protein
LAIDPGSSRAVWPAIRMLMVSASELPVMRSVTECVVTQRR